MNITTPIPTAILAPTANLSTESARRENTLRETIPQAETNEQGQKEQGLGSEGDKAKRATGQFNSPLVYEKPTPVNASASNSVGQEAEQDNGKDESAGREEAEERQKQQAEQSQIRQLKARDREVRAHEQAHASIGGQYAGTPQYTFETGPDGRRYAVGGEVKIDISAESDPAATVRKMQQVRAAALAPAEPSAQDLRVAAEATRRGLEARAQVQEQRNERFSEDDEENDVPSVQETARGSGAGIPRRTLDRTDLNEEQSDSTQPDSGQRTLKLDEQILAKRSEVIDLFYQNVSQPDAAGFSATA